MALLAALSSAKRATPLFSALSLSDPAYFLVALSYGWPPSLARASFVAKMSYHRICWAVSAGLPVAGGVATAIAAWSTAAPVTLSCLLVFYREVFAALSSRSALISLTT